MGQLKAGIRHFGPALDAARESNLAWNKGNANYPEAPDDALANPCIYSHPVSDASCGAEPAGGLAVVKIFLVFLVQLEVMGQSV